MVKKIHYSEVKASFQRIWKDNLSGKRHITYEDVQKLRGIIDDKSSDKKHDNAEDIAIKQQGIIVGLSENMSWAIHNLLTRYVSNDIELDQWESDYKIWCQRINETLSNRAFFNKMDQMQFNRSDFDPIEEYTDSYEQRYDWLISQLNQKLECLRNIISQAQKKNR
jgi:hypothetical protein